MSRYYRYKNGEEVMVRADLVKHEKYYMRSGYMADEEYKAATQCQVLRAGTVVHIRDKKNGRYFIEEDGCFDAWTDEMFESPNECYCSSLL